jgi:hypothetical protein
VHQRLDRAGDEAVVDEHVFMDVERRVAATISSVSVVGPKRLLTTA